MVLTGAPPVPRVLVVGTGSIGRRHIANLQSLRPGVRWGLLREGGRRDDFSDSLGAEVFGSLECAMAWKPDLAVVATPSDRHIETVPGLLDAGIGCYIEKPVVTIERDAERLLHMMRRPMPPTQVGCVLRFLRTPTTFQFLMLIFFPALFWLLTMPLSICWWLKFS